MILGREVSEPTSHVKVLDTAAEVVAAEAEARRDYLDKMPDTPAESADRWWPTTADTSKGSKR